MKEAYGRLLVYKHSTEFKICCHNNKDEQSLRQQGGSPII